MDGDVGVKKEGSPEPVTIGDTGISLGWRYHDKVHGEKIEGVAICVSLWFTGCNRVCLEYIHKGEIKEHWIDVNRAVLVPNQDAPTKLDVEKKPGGPGDVTRRGDPSHSDSSR
jgi:hypothetical protein